MSDVRDAVVAAWQVGGSGRQWRPSELLQQLPDEPLWLHLDRASSGLGLWLQQVAGVPDAAVSALLDEDTRPRLDYYGDGVMLILRGVNATDAAGEPEMVSLRLWITANRIITLRKRSLMSVRAVRQRYEEGRGPSHIGELLVTLVENLNEPMDKVTDAFEASFDHRENASGERQVKAAMNRVVRLRTSLVSLRRYIHPQQVALTKLLAAPPSWLGERDAALLRNAVDDVARQVEDLAALTERATLLHDHLSQQLAERLNRNMYLLSMVTVVFMPLTMVTGLLGVNLAGIPGADHPWAFTALCSALALLTLFELWLFRRIHLL